MKPSLQLRLSQHLALTPQLQQSIRLLQLSTLELQQEVDQMLDQNPFLEADEDNAAGERTVERAASAEPPADTPTDTRSDREDTGFDGGEEAAGIDNTDFDGAERREWENGTEGDDFDGITPGGTWEDLKTGLQHLTKWKRCAVVSDKDWVKHGIALFGWTMPGDVKVFAESDTDQAIEWAAAAESAER